MSWYYRTNDDGEMLAYVSGYDGGAPRPELAFTNVLVGILLRALYGSVPAAPWYGIYLHGLQFLALTLTTWSLHILLDRAPKFFLAVPLTLTFLLAAEFIIAVQFTIVAFLVTLAGSLTFLSLLVLKRQPILAVAIGGGVAALGSLVRLQSFGAALVIVAGLFVALSLRQAGLQSLALASFLLFAIIAASLGVLVEQIHYERSGSEGWRADLELSVTSLTATASAASIVRSRGLEDSLTDNDLAMIEAFVVPFDLTESSAGSFKPPHPDERRPRASMKQYIGLDRVAGAFRSSHHGRAWAWSLLLLLPFASLSRGRRAFVLSASLSSTVLLFAVALATISRLPDRVALPLALLGVISVSIVGMFPGITSNREGNDPNSSRSEGSGQLSKSVSAVGTLACFALLAVGAIAEAEIIERENRDIATSTTKILSLLEDLEGYAAREAQDGRDMIFALWLFPNYLWAHPLEWNAADRYRVTTIEIAGWGVATPYRVQRRDDLDINDWLGAIADRDDVWLVASPDKALLLEGHFRERRNWLCPDVIYEAGGVVADRYHVVKRVIGAPCHGSPVNLSPRPE
jgi:MFS family permease